MKNKLFFYIKNFYFIAPIIFYFGERSLVAYDEGIYALQAKWILENNNWITPMKWGAVVDDRTIGIQFLIAFFQKLLGQHLFVIYIPSLIFGILMIWFTFELHKDLTNRPLAIISPLILSTTYLWINYFHMATQDIIFASLTTLGIFASIKSYKTKKEIYLFFSGAWIGLAVMMKTYLVIIPLIAITPFLWKTKIIKENYFWIGFFVGFLPFFTWSILMISINGWGIYSGLYSKLVSLSENNVFTNPFYYYLWNFTINTLPWSIFSIIGFIQITRTENKLANYFLFKYPLFIMILLSIFSTKTPYYPLQIISLTSINAFLGINYFFSMKNKIRELLNKFLFTLIPCFLLASLLYLNINKTMISIDKYHLTLINLCLIIFSISWLSLNFFKKLKNQFIIIMIGPYLMASILVQSGIFNDRSKAIRIEAQKAINQENLSQNKVEIITSGLKDVNATKTIIKLALFMPNLGNGVNSFNELKNNQYAWIALKEENLVKKYKNKIVYDSENLYPWKLIIK